MYKQFSTTDPNGFPIELDKFLKFQQEAYNYPIEAIAKSYGNMVVIDGVTEGGGNITDGFAVINNEVVYVAAGAVKPYVQVDDQFAQLVYKGGVPKNVLKTRVATLVDANTGVAYSSLKRAMNNVGGLVDRLMGVEAALTRAMKILQPLLPYTDTATGATVYGSWLFWGRPASEIPTGWAEVLPSEYELRGRVMVGLHPNLTPFNTLGKMDGTIGEKLEGKHIAPHAHLLPDGILHTDRINTNAVANPFQTVRNVFGQPQPFNRSVEQEQSGGGENNSLFLDYNDSSLLRETTHLNQSPTEVVEHNNLQPYRVVLYIRFVG